MKSRNKNQDVMLSASVGCIDPLEYKEMIQILDKGGINGYHFDLSDGHFAPTIVLSIPTIGAFRRCTENRIDVHMYCTHPSTFLKELWENGADMCIICVESEENIFEVIHKVRDADMRAGVSVLPTSKIPDNMPEIIAQVDMVIANMVGPAYPGQPFNPRGLENLSVIKEMVSESGKDVEIGVDGNVGVRRLRDFLGRGARHLVCGTASIFIPDTDAGSNIHDLRKEMAVILDEHNLKGFS